MSSESCERCAACDELNTDIIPGTAWTCGECGLTNNLRARPTLNQMKKVQAGISDGSTADYYKLPPDSTQLQDLISHRDMNAQMGEIFRATYRYGIASHSDKLRDAKKIKFYIEAEIARLEKLNG